ncbi:QueT transporter family protein [Natranaerobius trueperi]|uniref:Transporter n=1 Tax=Natranaerobius trueperi TaxID=759412 RepID=A0A226C381_9FIRM|nr:QueT transporter family protein [Natranaerobius trueperi]OWZ84877.1 transporter [Natranaerobius trueperi]
MKSRDLIRIALIAAIYVALTLLFAPISFGVVQIRISEALTVLPYLFKTAIPGLTIGVFIANIFGGLGLIDVVFGSAATFLAAVLTRKMPSPFLAPIPPIIVNALIVGGYLSVLLDWPILMGMMQVGVGQLLACYLLGVPVLLGITRISANNEYLSD